MTGRAPFLSTHGTDLVEGAKGRVDAFKGGALVAWAFPRVVADPGGAWFVKVPGVDAVLTANRHEALAVLVAGCPACTCDPIVCEADDSGHSCQDCGACVSGCPEDVCDLPAAPNPRKELT